MRLKLTQIFKFGKGKKASSRETGKRFNDAVLILRHDTGSKMVAVEGSNLLALKLMGCNADEVIEKDLRDFLPQNIAEMINDNMEFETSGNSIDKVLNRMPYFRIKSKDGAEIPLKVRIVRSLSSSASTRFQLVMNDSSLQESLEANRDSYRSNMRGSEIRDKKTGMLSKDSMLKDLELISTYDERNGKESCYVIFKFINFDDFRIENGEQAAYTIIDNVAKIIDHTKRGDDISGLIGDGAVILILPETPKENVKIPIERICHKLPAEIKSKFRIYYNSVKHDISVQEQVATCMKGMAGTF